MRERKKLGRLLVRKMSDGPIDRPLGVAMVNRKV